MASSSTALASDTIILMARLTRKALRKIVLTSAGDFFNGMATAWAFASYDAFSRWSWWDLINTLALAIVNPKQKSQI